MQRNKRQISLSKPNNNLYNFLNKYFLIIFCYLAILHARSYNLPSIMFMLIKVARLIHDWSVKTIDNSINVTVYIILRFNNDWIVLLVFNNNWIINQAISTNKIEERRLVINNIILSTSINNIK